MAGPHGAWARSRLHGHVLERGSPSRGLARVLMRGARPLRLPHDFANCRKLRVEKIIVPAPAGPRNHFCPNGPISYSAEVTSHCEIDYPVRHTSLAWS